MAKKALLKDTFREIKRTFSRFMSILAIVALGVGFFSGIKATGPDMKLTGNKYFKDTNLMDLRLVSTMGFDEDDVQAVKSVDGVKEVEPSYSLDAIYTDVESKPVVSVHAIPDSINTPVLKEGRMPQNENECLAESGGMFSGIEIGDTIHIASDDGKSPISDWLKNDTYTVVGLVESPLYISYEYGSSTIGNGTVSTFLMIDKSNFKSEYYTQLYITADKPDDMSAFDYSYDTLVSDIKDKLESISTGRIEERYDEVVTEANDELNKNKADFEKAKSETEEKLSDAKNTLDTSLKELEDGQKQLEDGERELKQKEKDGRAELDKNRAELDSSLKTYNDERAKFDKTKKETLATLEETEKELDEAENQLNENQTELDSNKAQLDEMRATLDESWAKYNDGVAQLEDYKLLANSADSAFKFPLFITEEQLNQLVAGLEMIDSQTAADMKEYVTTVQDLKVPSVELIKRLRGEIQAMFDDIETKQTTLDESLNELKTYEEQYDSSMSSLNEFQSQLDAGRSEIQNGRKQLIDGYKALEDGESKLNSAKAQIDDGYAQLEAGEREFERSISIAYSEIASQKQKLENGFEEWEDGNREYLASKADAEKQLADAEARIKEGEDQIKELERPKWYFFTRDDNPGYSGFGDDADRINSIAAVFPVFFILVAALVSLTTMTRMVEEQRTQIGTLKALGYPLSSIIFKFLVYSSSASIVGSILGSVVGMWLFPTVIFNAYRIMYHMPSVIAPFRWDYAIICTLAAVIGTGAAALAACYAEMTSTPAILMRPKSPKAGKRVLLERVTFIWKRLGFIQKVTVRNLFRYKRKIFMTVLGIAGCTALMLAGFGVKNSIEEISDKQFGTVFKYDMIAALDDDYSPEDTAEISKSIHDITGVKSVLPVYSETLKTIGTEDVNTQDIMLYVPETPDKLDEYISLHERKTLTEVPLTDDGAVITEKLASLLSVSAGDTITVTDERQDKYEIKISGIVENYTSHFMYMTPEYYSKVFSDSLSYNMIFTNLDDAHKDSQSDISEDLLKLDGILGISGSSALTKDFDDMISTLNYVIIVLILSASALAFVVLYNLSNVNVNERIREIATIKVLGFYDTEVTKYIFRENVLLTAMGIGVGLVLGIMLHRFVIITAEIDTMMFGRNIRLLSYVYSAVLTALFAGIVNIALHFKLKKVSMVESLKSVE